jgi:hypothetical protein
MFALAAKAEGQAYTGCCVYSMMMHVGDDLSPRTHVCGSITLTARNFHMDPRTSVALPPTPLQAGKGTKSSHTHFYARGLPLQHQASTPRPPKRCAYALQTNVCLRAHNATL